MPLPPTHTHTHARTHARTYIEAELTTRKRKGRKQTHNEVEGTDSNNRCRRSNVRRRRRRRRRRCRCCWLWELIAGSLSAATPTHPLWHCGATRACVRWHFRASNVTSLQRVPLTGSVMHRDSRGTAFVLCALQGFGKWVCEECWLGDALCECDGMDEPAHVWQWQNGGKRRARSTEHASSETPHQVRRAVSKHLYHWRRLQRQYVFAHRCHFVEMCFRVHGEQV